jgi:hypothetical protein
MTGDEQNDAVAWLGFGDGLIELGEDRLAACRRIKQERLRDDLDGGPGFVLQGFGEASGVAARETQLLDFFVVIMIGPMLMRCTRRRGAMPGPASKVEG